MDLGKIELTWYGHATFGVKTPAGKYHLIDPFLSQNPKCPEKLKSPSHVDVFALTHGHMDHIADVVDLGKKLKPKIVCMNELAGWLGGKGVENAIGMNKGGTVEVEGVKYTMTDAVHSSGINDGDTIVYGGEAAGYILRFEDDVTIYHAGDTMVFGDMKIIADLYHPDIALLPIGDHFTMDPEQGAYACKLLAGLKAVVPMHYGTWPILTGTPARFKELVKGVSGLQVVEMQPGETLTGELRKLAAV